MSTKERLLLDIDLSFKGSEFCGIVMRLPKNRLILSVNPIGCLPTLRLPSRLCHSSTLASQTSFDFLSYVLDKLNFKIYDSLSYFNNNGSSTNLLIIYLITYEHTYVYRLQSASEPFNKALNSTRRTEPDLITIDNERLQHQCREG
ncbi:jg15271 [Pararge aegeria aegeria]|uniref:Jg15271 protein n=1 Tax=Pararge aegeria aegeria TaxID=348720 RepID=A0A8S4R417_9NEOP|nr:jg15271 [Pararge aegeria aegeria]